MKRIGIVFLLLVACLTAHAQQLNVKSVTLRRNDARARTNPRDDANGNKCAIIRVGVVGVEDLEFPDAVGKVEYSMNEYVVYVPDGLKKLKYKSRSNQYQGTVDFDYWGLEVNSQASYDVIFETDNHLRSAIFFITPTNATLLFNHKKVKLDKDGMATINMPPGEYYYMVEADGYQTQNSVVTLVEDDISATKHVLLEQRKHQIPFRLDPTELGWLFLFVRILFLPMYSQCRFHVTCLTITKVIEFPNIAKSQAAYCCSVDYKNVKLITADLRRIEI